MTEDNLVQNCDSNIEHERLVSLIGSMSDAVIAVNKDTAIAVYNGATLNLLDRNTSIESQSLGNVVQLYDKNGQQINFPEMVRNCTTPLTSRDYNLHYKDGSKANIYFSVAPVRLGYGANDGYGHVILLRDITREKSLEEERDEFISVVSHELRTPIAIAEGNISNAQFASQKIDDPNQVREALKIAHEQVVFLSDLINDLSTLSRAERGKLNLELEEVDVESLLGSLEETYRPDAEAKHLELHTEIKPEATKLYTAPLYLKEILQNFVTNAIKYTEEGSVAVSAVKTPSGIAFSITDTGIGISKMDTNRVFDKFFRSENFRTRAHNGTGLGLYVTSKLASLIKAEISVESQLGVGSTFTISVPDLFDVTDEESTNDD